MSKKKRFSSLNAVKTYAHLTVGGLSNPAKMPGFAFGVPARHCKTGSKLRTVPNSVCSTCYALKGNYVFPCVQNAQQKRFNILMADLPAWSGHMSTIARGLVSHGQRFFRAYDSGDVQSPQQIGAWFDIARSAPRLKFWLPTKERKFVKQALDVESKPDNITIRLSAPLLNQAPKPLKNCGLSAVHTAGHKPPQGFVECKAYTRGGSCGPCRVCWTQPDVNVSYPIH